MRYMFLFLTKKGLKYDMQHATKMQGWRSMLKEVQHDMNEQNYMTWYGGLNQKQKLA
jgi:hypothetical protein